MGIKQMKFLALTGLVAAASARDAWVGHTDVIHFTEGDHCIEAQGHPIKHSNIDDAIVRRVKRKTGRPVEAGSCQDAGYTHEDGSKKLHGFWSSGITVSKWS